MPVLSVRTCAPSRRGAVVVRAQLNRIGGDQTGKLAVITGCTTGIGYLAAREFASRGGSLVLLNRPSERAVEAESRIKEAASSSATVTSVPCDLSDFQSVSNATEIVLEAFPDGIDVLCNNAGVLACRDLATKDGYDIQMQVNHLSHFLLTRELLPLLEKTASRTGEARVIQHSSIARSFPLTPLGAKYLGKNGGNLGGDSQGLFNDGPRMERYHQTKLANAVFHYALDERLRAAGSGIKALLAHPGVVNTEIWDDDAGLLGKFLGRVMGISAEKGTLPLFHCMCGDSVRPGDFWGPTGPAQTSGPLGIIAPEKWCTDTKAKEMLWAESCRAIGKDFDVEEILRQRSATALS